LPGLPYRGIDLRGLCWSKSDAEKYTLNIFGANLWPAHYFF
jgi:hypothetical protein